jgi:ABC-type branched-subunit amino acid transport system substrate-binding protein
MSRKIRRRDVLKGIGAAGIAGLAGCTGGDGGDGGGDGGSTPTPTEAMDESTPTETMGGETTTAAPGTTAMSGRTIRMGILMGVTGGLKQLGPPIRQATELAVMHVNDADTPFTVDTQFEDTATQPPQGVSGGEALANAGYPMICGALSSEVSLQVANNVSIPSGITQCSPASTSPAFTTLEDDDFIFRTAATDALQGALMAQLVAERLGHDSAATLYLNNAYGNGLNQGFADAFESQHGGNVTAQVSFQKAQSSYTSQLQTALEDDPGVMIVVGYPDSGIQIFKDFYSEFDRGDMDVLVSDGLRDPSLPGSVGFDMSNVKGTAPAGTGPGTEYFNSEYTNEYGEEPGQFTKQSYDAAAVLMLANAAAGENDGAAVRDNMRAVASSGGEEVTPETLGSGIEMAASGTEVNYQGASGPVGFDDAGDLSGAVYSYYEFTADGLNEIESIEYGG